ncbi:LOW QUALITY PROTEIN: pancreatic lipase-related protein 3 [Rhynchonycteris naso]
MSLMQSHTCAPGERRGSEDLVCKGRPAEVPFGVAWQRSWVPLEVRHMAAERLLTEALNRPWRSLAKTLSQLGVPELVAHLHAILCISSEPVAENNPASFTVVSQRVSEELREAEQHLGLSCEFLEFARRQLRPGSSSHLNSPVTHCLLPPVLTVHTEPLLMASLWPQFSDICTSLVAQKAAVSKVNDADIIVGSAYRQHTEEEFIVITERRLNVLTVDSVRAELQLAHLGRRKGGQGEGEPRFQVYVAKVGTQREESSVSSCLLLVSVCLVFFFFSGKEICYERVGCFRDGLPWTGTWSRQLAGLPSSPEEISTRFLLYTRHNPKAHQEVSAVNYQTLQASHFRTDKMTHITIPGWKSDRKWQRDMCNGLLRVEDVNCINVDWVNGSREYIHAVNNLRVVGAEVAYFIDVLVKQFGYSPSKVYLIGHSLGAHLAREAGSRTPGLGRITGLDPAGPYFHNTPNEVRLDPSDANFVDVIHTNAVHFLFEFGAGTINACGHLDFYPNGGKHMPGCGELITPLFQFNFSAYKEEMASCFDCNHGRSQRFCLSILDPDAFIAYPCRSYESFKAGNCFHCPKEGCPTMGHFADRFHLKNKKPNRLYYFLNTGAFSPFARWRHKLSVRLHGNNITRGNFLRVGGMTRKTEECGVASGTLKPGMTYTKLVDAEVNVGNITSIEFIWKAHSFGCSQNKLGAEMVVDSSGKYEYEPTFCSQDIKGPNIAQILTPC